MQADGRMRRQVERPPVSTLEWPSQNKLQAEAAPSPISEEKTAP